MSFVSRSEEGLIEALQHRKRHPHPNPIPIAAPVAPVCPVATIRVFNRSSVVPTAELAMHLPGLQAQVCLDFAPFWLIEGALVLDDGTGLKRGEWSIELIDSDPTLGGGVLGYHEDRAGVPTGHVFAATAKRFGLPWSGVFSHEALEMLGDPRTNMVVAVDADPQGTSGQEYFAEACDAVEQSEYTITVAGVQTVVSDFVTPAWFDPSATAGPFDHLGLVKAALELEQGGSYIGTRSISSPGWTQKTAEKAPTP